MIKILLAPFKVFYKILDTILITPISKLVYKISGIFKSNNGRLESIFNRPNVLVYFSLACAIIIFLLVDTRVVNLTEREAEVISGQSVSVIYNNEAYVVEGVPSSVDITLIGSKSSIYLASQLGDHEVTLDLSGYGPGTHKVKLKYNHSVESVDYKLDPSTITVKISEKVSEVFPLTYDLMNENSMNQTLSVSDVKIDKSEVIAKSSQEILGKIASVKALVDTSKITLKSSGTQNIEDVMLVAYDTNGDKVDNVELVPGKVSATVSVDSYHKSIPVKVVTDGTMASGKAISEFKLSVNNVDVYGDKEVIDKIENIEAPINIDGLSSNKNISIDLTKPNGVRYMNQTKTNVNIVVGDEAQSTISGVVVQATGLSSENSASAATEEDRTIDVIVKGTSDVINNISAESIYAYVDLSGLKTGSQTVPVMVKVDDPRIQVQPAKTSITVNIK